MFILYQLELFAGFVQFFIRFLAFAVAEVLKFEISNGVFITFLAKGDHLLLLTGHLPNSFPVKAKFVFF
jgi:hypothetical protein